VKCRLDHSVPDWVTTEPSFFITVNAQLRGINHFCKAPTGLEILGAVQKYHEAEKWFCSLALLMPDHVHMIITMSPQHDLAKTISAWKKWLARHLRIDWQKNFFDHRVRRERGEDDKGGYVLANPVRAGFVEKAEDWPWIWMPGKE
jgi:putative transposase